MEQTKTRKILKDAPIMWRRINSIGIILDCNSTYAVKLGYAKSEILGKPIFEHVSKDSWQAMNDSLRTWFETGKVSDRKITFLKQNGETFPVVLQATSLYDEKDNLLGSNTVIFDITELTDEKISQLQKYFQDAKSKLDEIKDNEYDDLEAESKSEYDGLKDMFEMLLSVDLKTLRD